MLCCKNQPVKALFLSTLIIISQSCTQLCNILWTINHKKRLLPSFMYLSSLKNGSKYWNVSPHSSLSPYSCLIKVFRSDSVSAPKHLSMFRLPSKSKMANHIFIFQIILHRLFKKHFASKPIVVAAETVYAVFFRNFSLPLQSFFI